MKMTAGQLAAIVNGTLEGDPEIELSYPSKIEEAIPGSVCFLGNLKYEHYLYGSPASLVIVPTNFQASQQIHPALLRVENVYQTVSQLLELFSEKNEAVSVIHQSAIIDPSAKIGANVHVGAYTVIEEGAVIDDHSFLGAQVFIGKNVKLGHSVKLFPGVRIYHDCVLGDSVTIHSNTVIGSDGFGFVPNQDKSYKKIAQIGNVIVGSHVEIGSNTTIDRGTMGSTIIEEGCKLDNLIQVAHNVSIGAHTVIAAQAGIAGSAKIGKYCMIGGQVGIAGHLEIADGSIIQAQSGIASSIEEKNRKWYGSPAIDYFTFLRVYAEFKKLPETSKQVRDLINVLKSNQSQS
ncbi:MAG: UDP-3-O-(3-hydroxymyristoyl)glucosamine N-acyltransferase [Saprospiraceae bacterium]|nr:UDP-3-O-(3-hydroxymyristoyl)glucosamine N-acyltransferase [Saprospiraceae bacterium]MBK7812399.1 UDP-3-O-(3-hydroxymyristoyl)glucosamine N-acyltransferase [Saprospiraceae bacterium]